VRDEVFAALSARAAGTLRELRDLALLPVILPEITALEGVTQGPPHRHDVWKHTLEVVALLEQVLEWISGRTAARHETREWKLLEDRLAALRPALASRLRAALAGHRSVAGLLLLAGLFHDCGKAQTRSVGEDGRIHFYRHEHVGARQVAARLETLRFARAEIQWVAAAVRHHLRPLHLARSDRLSDRALHRFHRATAPLGPEVCLLSLADNLAKGERRTDGEWAAFVARVGELLDAWFLRRLQVVDPEPLVRGRDLLEELALTPGPRVGKILQQLLEAQAAGEITTREEALALARRRMKDER
jgi:tRNA nucleotidyltransferase/poly(A) polymerase